MEGLGGDMAAAADAADNRERGRPRKQWRGRCTTSKRHACDRIIHGTDSEGGRGVADMYLRQRDICYP